MTYNQLNLSDVNKTLKEKYIEATNGYVNTKTPCTFKCLLCGNNFINRYDIVRYWKGIGCNDCKKVTRLKSNKEKRTKNRMEKLNEKLNKNVELISFSNDGEKCTCRCKICERIFISSYDSLIQGSMHKSCASKIANMDRIIPKDDFIKNMKNRNSIINILDFGDETKSANEKCKCECNICHYIWFPKRKDIRRGRGCPECAKKNRIKNSRKYILNVNDILSSYDLSFIKILDNSDDVSSMTKILVKCKNCGYVFSTTIHYLRRYKIGCIECNKIKRQEKYTEESINKLKIFNPHLHIISDFSCSTDIVEVYCDQCGKTFQKNVHELLRCPCCNYCVTNSKMEYRIVNYLGANNISFESHVTFDKLRGVNNGKLSYDFYLKDFNLLIECQGIQHEKSVEYFGGETQFEIQQEHDKRKRQYAKKHNIELLEIWYYESDKIEEIINHKLNINNKKESA